MDFKGYSQSTDHSIIIAGPTASGKSHLIDKLKPVIAKARIMHREEAEALKLVPKNAIVHWPAAEKFPKDLDLSNVGLVILINKPWQDYCNNVESRKHWSQYSRSGLRTNYET